MIIVAALYRFFSFTTRESFHPILQKLCEDHGIQGTLLLAEEGINGTIAGSRQGIDALKTLLLSIPELHDMEYKESTAQKMPFYRLKVRLKKEIVTLGLPEISPVKKVGQYVQAKDWNNLIAQEDVLLIDTRNDYEVEVGHFQKALNPQTKKFRDFPDFVQEHLDPHTHKKVAMYCTGGIRCEKASSYLLEQGFESVFHLQGGILKYLEEVPAKESLWKGECFVFDERVSLQHALDAGTFELCRACRAPLGTEDKKNPFFEEGVSCPQCAHQRSEKQKNRAHERQKQMALAHLRGQRHLGRY